MIDTANLFTPEQRARLEAKLEAHEKKNGEVVVVTVPSLGGLSSKDYANKLFRYWRLQDVLLVASKEGEFYIKTADDYCRELTSSALTMIVNTIVGNFRHGDLAVGIEAGVDQMLPKIRYGQSLRRSGYRAC